MRFGFLLLFVALGAACGGTAPTGVHGNTTGSGGSGATTSSGGGNGTVTGTGGGCSYPPVDNPPGCPAAYSDTYSGQPCSMAGLTCSYPGVGDGMPDGCFSTAGLSCTTQFSDGGAPEWRAGQ